MKNYPVVKLLVWISLFALAAPGANACENEDAMHVEHFHGNSDQEVHDHGDSTASCHTESDHPIGSVHPDQPCPDEDDCCGCHCPDCALVSFHHHFGFLTDFPGNLKPVVSDTSIQRRGFYFDRHLPEAVDLPIWQPPKW
jgi:hypothetical protein